MTYDWRAEQDARTRIMWAEGAERDQDGIWRWRSNGSIPPKDILELMLTGDELARNLAAYDAELAVFLADYRRTRRNRVVSDEERFELTAAFGPDADIVDVITGERIVY